MGLGQSATSPIVKSGKEKASTMRPLRANQEELMPGGYFLEETRPVDLTFVVFLGQGGGEMRHSWDNACRWLW